MRSRTFFRHLSHLILAGAMALLFGCGSKPALEAPYLSAGETLIFSFDTAAGKRLAIVSGPRTVYRFGTLSKVEKELVIDKARVLPDPMSDQKPVVFVSGGESGPRFRHLALPNETGFIRYEIYDETDLEKPGRRVGIRVFQCVDVNPGAGRIAYEAFQWAQPAKQKLLADIEGRVETAKGSLGDLVKSGATQVVNLVPPFVGFKALPEKGPVLALAAWPRRHQRVMEELSMVRAPHHTGARIAALMEEGIKTASVVEGLLILESNRSSPDFSNSESVRAWRAKAQAELPRTTPEGMTVGEGGGTIGMALEQQMMRQKLMERLLDSAALLAKENKAFELEAWTNGIR